MLLANAIPPRLISPLPVYISSYHTPPPQRRDWKTGAVFPPLHKVGSCFHKQSPQHLLHCLASMDLCCYFCRSWGWDHCQQKVLKSNRALLIVQAHHTISLFLCSFTPKQPLGALCCFFRLSNDEQTKTCQSQRCGFFLLLFNILLISSANFVFADYKTRFHHLLFVLLSSPPPSSLQTSPAFILTNFPPFGEISSPTFFIRPVKTVNILLIGPRGSGKSSLKKTCERFLRQEQDEMRLVYLGYGLSE